jgi:uncharacterized iron-regulated membrane protein
MPFERQSFMQGIRSILFWIHLSVGISAGVIILLMSVTGVMLGFERQMIAWIDGKPVVEQPGEAPLPLDTLMRLAGIERSAIGSVVVKSAAQEPVTVRFRDRAIPARALDPYSGEAIPTPQGGEGQAFFSGLRRWHRWIGASAAEVRATARAVTGAANLAFLFLVLSGLWLWWPRSWSLARLRNTAMFRRGLRGKARDFNWHHAIGFWSAVPLAIVVATGVFISYQWPERWLDRTLGSPAEKAAAARVSTAATAGRAASISSSQARGAAEPRAPRTTEASLEALLDAAARERPDWSAVTMTLGAATDSTHSVLVASGNTYRPDQRTTLVMDATGARAAPLAIRDYASLSASRKIRAWVRFGHTGEVFGIAGQVIATLVTAAGALLVWTGIALSLRRFMAWRRRRAGERRDMATA